MEIVDVKTISLVELKAMLFDSQTQTNILMNELRERQGIELQKQNSAKVPKTE
jgi:hypothetical protein